MVGLAGYAMYGYIDVVRAYINDAHYFLYEIVHTVEAAITEAVATFVVAVLRMPGCGSKKYQLMSLHWLLPQQLQCVQHQGGFHGGG